MVPIAWKHTMQAKDDNFLSNVRTNYKRSQQFDLLTIKFAKPFTPLNKKR